METVVFDPTRVLVRVIEISNTNIPVENRLKHICDFLSREAAVECVCVYRRDGRTETLAPWVSSCVEIAECTQLDFRIRPGEGVAGKAVQKRAPVFVPDVRRAPPSLAVAQELRDFRSILSIPVMDDVYLYGAMNLSARGLVSFPEETVAVLRIAGTEVAGAIRNSRLYHDARKRVSELITLNEIGRAITSTFQVKEILGYVAQTTSRLLQAEGCTVRMEGKGPGGISVMVDEGYGRMERKREPRAHGNTLARQIFREKRAVLINGPEDSPLYLPLSRKGVFSFLGVPIISKGKALGVINYYSGSPNLLFDLEGMHLMQTVCSQLANMLENASTFEQVRRLAEENQAKVRRLTTLHTMAHALMSTVKTDRLLQVTLKELTSSGGMGFDRAVLFLLSTDRKRLEARRVEGVPLGERKGEEAPEWGDVARFALPVGAPDCLVARAVRERQPMRAEGGCPAGKALEGSGFCGIHPAVFAVVPLVVQGEARGAIYVDKGRRGEEILEEEIQTLTTFASEVGLALENTSLYESLERALETIRQTQDRLLQSEKLAALGEMAAMIAHEIKNPLTVIGGFAARIARRDAEGEADHPSAARYAGIILREVQRLERIVQQTLYFSRDVALSPRPVDLHTEIREVLGLFREELEEGGIRVDRDLRAEGPSITGDPDQIRQLLWNLISNAIQAMGGGGTLSLATRDGSVEEAPGVMLVVGDTGGGISHSIVHNIFNPFFTTKPKGTGLGLPIVHAIVQKHGGTIHLDNREGEGAVFSVFLPREPREPRAGERIIEQLRKGTGNGVVA